MKLRKLMLYALGAAAAAAVSVACSDVSLYKIDAPEDLQSRIDEIAEKNKPVETDGKTSVVVTKFEIGASDYSTGWWGDHSQSFEVAPGRLLHIEFDNYGSRANNWNNWNLALVSVGGGAHSTDDDSAYSEYFVMRSDLYGWGNGDYDGGLIASDYSEVIGEVDDMWAVFRDIMYGAHVVIELDHSSTGYTYMTASATSADGSCTITETYNHPTPSTSSVYAFLITDSSYMVMDADNCWTEASRVTEIEDFDAVSIEVTGHPVTIPLGEEDYWGNAVAIITFEDGSTINVGKDDLTIVEPDLTTTGTKTVAYSYNLTKLGNMGKAVVGYYNFEVTDLASIAVTKAPVTSTYYVYDQAVPFYTEGLEVTGTKGDGSTIVLDNTALSFGMVQPTAGTQDIEIDFSGVKTTYPVTVKTGTEAIGAIDFTNGWWTTFLSADKSVAAGESVTVHMFLYSDNLANWHSPCTILRKADLGEYAVVRMDNFGWGDGYGTAVLENDWPDWDTFMVNQNMSAVSVTVTNNGDNTADILYNVTYATGDTHYQKYSGVTVDSADLQMSIVTEESYIIVLEQAAADAKLTGISATATANVIGGAKYVTLSPEAIKVMANYSDGTSVRLASSDVEFTFPDMTVDATPGKYTDVATVTYSPAGAAALTAGVTLTIKASTQEAQTEQVGATDFSNAWWTTFSRDWTVAPGESQSVSMTLGSDNLENWHSPCTILRKASMAEYCVVRMDNFGWGDSYGAVSSASDWDWDTFKGALDGSKISVTVANDGNGTASIRYFVIDGNGTEHFQYYDNLAVDSSDMQFAFVTEESYLIFD